jgi:hypothetical protein
MHLRIPKPLHGWRAFAGEVWIIVIGVLIALAAEQAVEDWRWHGQVEVSTRGFKDELLSSTQTAYERMAIQPCLQGELRALSAQLVKGGDTWHALPSPLRDPRRSGRARTRRTRTLPCSGSATMLPARTSSLGLSTRLPSMRR